MMLLKSFFSVIIFDICLSCSCMAEQVTDVSRLSLPQAIDIAMEHNHDLKLSRTAIDTAVAAGLIARASPNPSLTLQSVSINPKEGVGAGTLSRKTIDSAIRVDQLIERGGKRDLRRETTARLEDAARADKSETGRQVRVTVSQAYYDLLAFDERLNILKQNAALYDSSVSAAQKRQSAGDLAAADLARLQLDALRVKNDVRQAEADVMKARQSLAILLGKLDIAPHIKLADTWPSPPSNLAEPSSSLVDRRPEVLAAKARLDAAIAARKLALASRSRDISVGVQYDHYPTSPTNTQGTGNSFGVFVQIPLFINHHFEGDIRIAELAVDAATETLEKTRDLASNEISQNWQDVLTSFELLQRYDNSLLIAAKKSADAAEFAFKHGAIGIMDVLDTRRTYKAIQLDALSARSVHAKSLAAWQVTQLENVQ